AQVEGHVAHVEVVVGKVLLDHVAAVAEADHELVDPVRRVDLHDVPEQRLRSQLDHRLRLAARLLAQPGAEAAGQDHRLHGYSKGRSAAISPSSGADESRADGTRSSSGHSIPTSGSS